MKIAPPRVPLPDDTRAQAEDKKLREVSKQFEGIFVNQMVSAMRKTVNREGGLIPESPAERVYQGMLDQEHAQKITESGELGLAELVYRHLKTQSAR